MSRSAQEIQDWLVARLSRVTGMPAEAIDVHQPLRRYGLDSIKIVRMIADLESWLHIRFQENPWDDYPTIAALAQYLAERDQR